METRKCLTLFSPLLVEKEPEYLTHARCFFGTRVHHPCGVLTFWIKSPFLVPTAGLSIIGQSHANRTSLDSVTFQKPHTVHHDLGFSMVPLFFFSIVFLYPSCQFYAPPPHCGWLFRLRQPMAVPSGADQSVVVHTEGIGSPWSSEGEGWKSGSGEHSGKI